MSFRKNLYYVALTEFLLKKKSEIIINDNISLTINVRRSIYCQSPSSWLDIPSLDFFCNNHIKKEMKFIHLNFTLDFREPKINYLIFQQPLLY